MRYLILTTIFYLSACASTTKTTPSLKTNLDAYIDRVENKKLSMGSVTIHKEQKEIYSRAFGFQNVENKIKATKETEYFIGSISKTYTSVIILKLIEENKLKLTNKLSKFYPRIPNSKLITIEQILRHRSGLFNFTEDKDYPKYQYQIQQEKDHINRAIKFGTIFTPNEKYSYSNQGYVLLSLIAQKVSGLTYDKLLLKYITKPLNLTHTYLPISPNSKPNLANSYVSGKKWGLYPMTHYSVPLGAGAIVSSSKDLAIFLDSLFSGKLLSESSLALMTKFDEKTGLGLFKFPFNKRFCIGHNGSIDGFRSIACHIPEDKITYVQLINASKIVNNDLTLAALAYTYELNYKLPSFEERKVKLKILNKYIGIYSAKNFPLKLKIFTDEGKLYGQATGQGAFRLTSIDDQTFEFPSANILIKFNSKNSSFDFKQGKYKNIFKKTSPK